MGARLYHIICASICTLLYVVCGVCVMMIIFVFELFSSYFIQVFNLLEQAIRFNNFDDMTKLLVWIAIPALTLTANMFNKFTRNFVMISLNVLLISSLFFIDDHKIIADISFYICIANLQIWLFSISEVISNGKTIAKSIYKMKVESFTNLNFFDYLFRNYLKSLGIIFWPLSLIFYIIKKQTPWDAVCGTYVE